MFGYVRIAREELKVKELTRYNAYYCGVCRAMSQYTFVGRVVLSYDLAFYALLTDPNAQAEIGVKRCKWNLKKKPYAYGKGLDYAGVLNLLLGWGKIKDDVADGKKNRKIALAFFKKAYTNAYKSNSDVGDIITIGLNELDKLEQGNCSHLDEVAHQFAHMCGEVAQCAPLIENEADKRIVYEIAYNIARWVYIIDAYDDMAEDKVNEEYNPILSEAVRRGIPEDEITLWIKDTLFQSLYAASKACELLPQSANTPIISNIINYGMHDKTVMVLKMQEDKKEDNHESV